MDTKDIEVNVVDMNGGKLSMTVSWEDDIYEWKDKLITMLTFLGFQSETIKAILPDKE